MAGVEIIEKRDAWRGGINLWKAGILVLTGREKERRDERKQNAGLSRAKLNTLNLLINESEIT